MGPEKRLLKTNTKKKLSSFYSVVHFATFIGRLFELCNQKINEWINKQRLILTVACTFELKRDREKWLADKQIG